MRRAPVFLARHYVKAPTTSLSPLRYCLFSTPADRSFFSIIKRVTRNPTLTEKVALSFLKDDDTLRSAIYQINTDAVSNYIYEHFIFWTSAFVREASLTLAHYFSGKLTLDELSHLFIRFCFDRHIDLEKERTLAAFSYHNQLSDNVVKRVLLNLPAKSVYNVLGFGLDNGAYEKSLIRYLLEHQKAVSVNLYGFDPYAIPDAEVQYLSVDQLREGSTQFDLITARWVLHHVGLAHRWHDFTQCINRCAPGAQVLVVEHGFLQDVPISDIEKKLYYCCNAFFDIVANIGIRPHYFTATAPDIGKDFFIHYLSVTDFQSISNQALIQHTQSIYDVGPSFPNQTMLHLRF